MDLLCFDVWRKIFIEFARAKLNPASRVRLRFFLGKEGHGVKESQTIFLNIFETIFDLKFFVVDALRVSLILGMLFISNYKYQLAAGTNSLKLTNSDCQVVTVPFSGKTIGMFSVNKMVVEGEYSITEFEIKEVVDNRSGLPEGIRTRLTDLLISYRYVFSEKHESA